MGITAKRKVENKMATNYKLSIEVQFGSEYEPVEFPKLFATIQQARSALSGQLRKYDRQGFCARGVVVPAA